MTSLNNFDEDEFDRNLCCSVYNIHKRAKINNNNKKFKKWLSNNLDHLKNLFVLSELNNCDFKTFCSFVYINSE